MKLKKLIVSVIASTLLISSAISASAVEKYLQVQYIWVDMNCAVV